jgi:hypothetical protein
MRYFPEQRWPVSFIRFIYREKNFNYRDMSLNLHVTSYSGLPRHRKNQRKRFDSRLSKCRSSQSFSCFHL